MLHLDGPTVSFYVCVCVFVDVSDTCVLAVGCAKDLGFLGP